MRDFKLVAFYRQRKHIDICFCVIVIIMSINEFDDNVFACDPLIKLHIPLDGAKVLIAPEHWVAVHGLNIQDSLQSLYMR